MKMQISEDFIPKEMILQGCFVSHFFQALFAIRILTIITNNCSIFDPFTEIPADVLLFQICIPFAIEHFKPRETIKALLRYWFSVVGWALGLIDFLLPKPEENGGHENGNVVVARRDRLRAERGLHDQLLLQHVAAENHDWRGRAAENTDIGEDSDVDDQADSE